MNDLERNVARLTDSLFVGMPDGPDRHANMLKAFDLVVPPLTKTTMMSSGLPVGQRKRFAKTAEDICREAFIKRLTVLEAKHKGRI